MYRFGREITENDNSVVVEVVSLDGGARYELALDLCLSLERRSSIGGEEEELWELPAHMELAIDIAG